VRNAKPVTAALSRTQRSSLAKADLAIHFGPEAWGAVWKTLVTDLEKQMIRKGDETGNAVTKQFIEALGEIRFVVAGLTLGEGARLDVIASFTKGKNSAAKKFLKALRAGPGSSDLVGLPRPDPLLAYAAKGDGGSNVAMVKALLNILFDRTTGIDKILPPTERQAFLGSLETMYRHLKGSRAAIYHTGAKSGKVGQLVGVAILDIDAPAKFLEQIPKMVVVVNKAILRALGGSGLPEPHFTYKARAETIDGVRVDLLTVRVNKLNAPAAETARYLFGPDWEKLRLAVLDKKVVLSLGSDKTLLRETLANLKKGAKGLAGNKFVVSTLAGLAPERKLEFHINLERFVPLMKGEVVELRGKVEGISSIALTVEADWIQLEIVAPKSEVQSFARAIGF
jgi:hypothetical protein